MTPFDFDRASAELQIDKNIYLRILAAAIAQTENDFAAITTAFDHEDLATIQSISHRWKGDFANLRLDILSTQAKALNDAAKAQKTRSELQGLYGQFLVSFKKLSQQKQGAQQNG